MRFNQVGLMITDRCNFKCGHCMFSCTPYGKEMSDEVIAAAKNFIEANDVYSVNIYGGEPFLNLKLFDKVFQEIYDRDRGFFVSSNGSFMASKSKREYVYDLLHTLRSNTSDASSIRISNTSFHKECRTKEQQKWLNMLRWYIKDPDLFSDENGYDEYNPFYGDRYGEQHVIYIEDDDPYSGMNPSGRALKHATITPNCCYCPMTSRHLADDADDFHLDIRPDGDLQICCTCDGCIVGNILEPDLTEEVLSERIKKLNHHFRKRYGVHKDTKMVDICETCRLYRIDGRGIKKRRLSAK